VRSRLVIVTAALALLLATGVVRADDTAVRAGAAAGAASADAYGPPAPAPAAAPAPAPAVEGEAPKPASKAPSLTATSLRMLLALAAIVAGVYGVRYAIARFGSRLPGLDPRFQAIRVVATRYFGGKKSVALVEVERHRILLGLGANEVRTLVVFDEAGEGAHAARTGEGEEVRFDA